MNDIDVRYDEDKALWVASNGTTTVTHPDSPYQAVELLEARLNQS